MRDDIREYNTIRVNEAVEIGKGLKKATNKEECRVMIPSLKEEDGSITTNRERILEGYAGFYEKLYDDTVQNIARTEQVLSILISEIERALSQMKSRKAPGGDKIVAERIRVGSETALRKIQELFNAVLRLETVPKEWKDATDIKEERQERHCQLQTYQPTLTYLEIIQESSEEQTQQHSRWASTSGASNVQESIPSQ